MSRFNSIFGLDLLIVLEKNFLSTIILQKKIYEFIII